MTTGQNITKAPEEQNPLTNVPCVDGIYYTWLPIVGNPSCVVLHQWIPDEDEWVQLDDVSCVPSRAWGTNTLRN